MATFGLDAGNATFDVIANYLNVMRFQNTVGDGILTQLEILYDDATPSGNVRLGVYADSSGTPAGLLLDAGAVAKADGWVAISGLNLEVDADAYYWLAFIHDATNGTRQQTGQAANSHIYRAVTYGALPTPFPTSGATYNNTQYVMRATVTAGGVTHYGAATLSGVGTLAGIGRGIFIGKSTLSGTGTLAAIGRRIFTGAATLTGSGTLAGIGRLIAIGKATLSGTGNLAGTGSLTAIGKATLSGVGTLAGIGRITAIGKATLSGIGTLAAAGTIGAIQYGAAVLSGVGSLAAKGVSTLIGKATLSGTGTLSGIGTLVAAASLQGLTSYTSPLDRYLYPTSATAPQERTEYPTDYTAPQTRSGLSSY